MTAAYDDEAAAGSSAFTASLPPSATAGGVRTPACFFCFAAALACACNWWCFDLPAAASATILT